MHVFRNIFHHISWSRFGQPNICNRKRILLKPTSIASLQYLVAQLILGPDILLFKQDVLVEPLVQYLIAQEIRLERNRKPKR